MKIYLLFIIVLLVSDYELKAQTYIDSLECLSQGKICQKNKTTEMCIEPYFPLYDYLNYGEDCLEVYWLFKYSWVLKSVDEEILYKNKERFSRILILNAKNSKIIRVNEDSNLVNITIKKFELDSFILPDAGTTLAYTKTEFAISKSKYYSIDKHLTKSDIYSVEPHPVQYFAFSDMNIICFESVGYGGYIFTDLYIPFIKDVKQFKGLLKYVDKLEKMSSK